MADTEFIPGMGTLDGGSVVIEEGPATIEPITAGSSQPIGMVESFAGSMTVHRADGTTDQLEAGLPIYQGDQLETSSDGSVGGVLADGTSFSMAESSKMVMDEMVYDPATQEGSIGINIVEGVFTFVSGQIAKTDPDAMTLETPVATIGIRGTQVGIEVGKGGQSNVVLMEEADGFIGEVTVSNGAGLQILNNALQGTSIVSQNSAPSETFTVDQGQMLNTFGGALGSLPNTGNNNNYKQAPPEEGAGVEEADTEVTAEEAAKNQEALGEEVTLTEEGDATDALSDFNGIGEGDAVEGRMETFEMASGGDGEELGQEVTATDEQDATEALSDFDGTGQSAAEEDIESPENVETASVEADEPVSEFIQVAGDGGDINLNLTVEVEDTSTEIDTIRTPVPVPETDPEPVVEEKIVSAPIITRRPESVELNEDGAQSIDLAVEPTDGDPVASVQLAGFPEGSTLTVRTGEETKTITVGSIPVTLSPAQLEGLQFALPTDYNTDQLEGSTFELTVFAKSQGGAVSTFESVPVTVAAVADEVFVQVAIEAVPSEDGGPESFALNVTADSDTEGDYEQIETVSVSGIPANVRLVLDPGDGSEPIVVDVFNPGALPEGVTIFVDDETNTQTITFTDDALSILDNEQALVVVPTDKVPSLDLTNINVEATSDEGEFGEEDVVLNPPEIEGDGEGGEDSAISLNFKAYDPDGEAAVETITISDIPIGATLSASTLNDDGTVTLTAAERPGLTNTPPEDDSEDFKLTVTPVSSLGARARETIEVEVETIADAPTLTVETAEGAQEGICLTLDTALTDTDDLETLAVEIGNLPERSKIVFDGEELFTATAFDSSFPLTQDQLEGLQFVPPEDSDGRTFDLQFTATATDTDPELGGVSTAQTTVNFTVSVDNIIDAPTVTVSSAKGNDDSAIPIEFIGVETFTNNDLIDRVTISNVPDGATLSAGTPSIDEETGYVIPGSFDLSADDLLGLSITLPENSDKDFSLTVEAVAVDGVDQSLIDSATVKIPVIVAAQADAPLLDSQAESGDEDTEIPSDIVATLADEDGLENITAVSIAGVPNGATLSAGTDNGDGNWTFTPILDDEGEVVATVADQLSGLTITPAADSSDNFPLTITAVSTDTDTETGEQTSATNTATLDVTVNAIDDIGTVSGGGAGDEGTAVDLSLAAVMDGATTEEITSVSVSGIPTGAVLKDADGNTLEVTNGRITLALDALEGVTITPPADSSDDFDLTLNLTDSDGGAVATGTANIAITGVDDLGVVNGGGSGDEDTAIDLELLASVSGVETVESVTINGVLDGVILSAGTPNEDGSITLTQDELAGLTITPPADFNGSLEISLSVVSTDGSESADVPVSISVSAVPDIPVVSLSVATGDEDTAIYLDITASVPNSTETVESVTISGVPGGASLSAGTDNGDGSWTLSPSDLGGLTLTPTQDLNSFFDLTVLATSSEGGQSDGASLNVDVEPVPESTNLKFTVSNESIYENFESLDLSNLTPDNFGTADAVEFEGGGTEATYVDADTAFAEFTDAWGEVSDIDADSDVAADASVVNFVDVDVDRDDGGDSTVTIDGAAQGDIFAGDGGNVIDVDAQSIGDDWTNCFNVDTYDGSDQVTVTGDQGGTKIDIDTGAGSYTINLDGNYIEAVVDAGEGNDVIVGGSGDDVILAGAGDDLMSGGSGSDVLDGSEGTDTLQVDNSYDDYSIQEDIDNGLLQYTAGEAGFSWAENTPSWDEGGVPVDQSNLTVPEAAEGVTVVFEGEDSGNHNTVGWYKLDENGDPMEPQVLFVDASEDGNTLEKSTEITLEGLEPGEQFGFFIIQDGANKYPDLAEAVDVGVPLNFDENGNITFEGGALEGTDDNDVLTGGLGADVIDGGDGDDTIIGGSDDDYLYGGEGDDNLKGEKGDDILEGGAVDDEIKGGSGDDTAVFSGDLSDYTVTIEASDIFFTGESLNPDGINHAISGINDDGNLMIGFEDLAGGGNNYLNDVTISVRYEGIDDGANADTYSIAANDGEEDIQGNDGSDGGYSVTDGDAAVNVVIDPSGMR